MDKNSTFFTKNFQISLFWVVFMKSYSYYTPTIFRRQTFHIMGIKGQKSTISEKKSKITKNCQKSWNFSKIWLLSPRIWLVAQTCPPLPNIWPFMKKKFFSYKKWDFLAIFLKKSKSDPPNLSKSATTRSSIKKCHKEKVIFSPIQGRMQKIRKKLLSGSREPLGFFFLVIYETNTRTGQGPYPALKAWECSNSDHLGGRRGPTAGVGPESGAFSSIFYVFCVFWFT